MLTPDSPRDMGGDQHASHDAHDTHDTHDTAHPCDCTHHNALELHALVAALAAQRGIDLCSGDPIDADDEAAMDLEVIHGLSIAQGAECPGDEEDDDDEMDDEDMVDEDEGYDPDDDSGEFELTKFSDDDSDGDDPDDSDEFSLDPDAPDAPDAPASIVFADDVPAPAPHNPSFIHDLATFDLGPPIDEGDYVRYKNARIFKAGHYPRKDYTLPLEEMAASIARVTRPIPLELEHTNSAGTATFIDGEYGVLENPRVEGEWTVGDVVLDKWVDRKWTKFLEKTGETAKQVSAVWNRVTNDIERVGLVIKGHVDGAALNVAFSDRDDDSAIDAMFDDAHDAATFATPRKHHPRMTHAWQVIHDQAAMVPGVCPANPIPPTSPAMMGDLPAQFKNLKSAHDNSVTHGAMCSGSVKMSEPETRSVTMSKAVATPDPIENEDTDVTDDEVTSFVHEHPDVVALKAELAAERKKNADAAAKFAEEAEAARVKAVKADAAAFADAEIAAGRSTAAEYTDLVLFYADAAELDHRSGEAVTFADASGAKATGSRVDALKAREAKRPGHGLFSQALGDGELLHDGERVLFNTKAADSEQSVRAAADAVLAKINEGRNILAKRQKAK